MVALLHDAQEIAIINGSEKLDKNSLSIAYQERMEMLHDRINCSIKRKSQTTNNRKNKPIVIDNVEAVPDEIESLTDVVAFGKKNELDAIQEISKRVSVEVVSI